MISIYKKENDTVQHCFVKSRKDIPAGWTDDIKSLDIDMPVSNEELFRQEADEIQKKITQGQNDISELQVAVTDLFESQQSKPNAEEGVEADG